MERPVCRGRAMPNGPLAAAADNVKIVRTRAVSPACSVAGGALSAAAPPLVARGRRWGLPTGMVVVCSLNQRVERAPVDGGMKRAA